eukprot:6490310-Amphidinium_carterae.4
MLLAFVLPSSLVLLSPLGNSCPSTNMTTAARPVHPLVVPAVAGLWAGGRVDAWQDEQTYLCLTHFNRAILAPPLLMSRNRAGFDG